MTSAPEPDLIEYLWLIPAAAILLCALFGALFLSGWLSVVAFVAVFNAAYPSHPIDPEEEISGS